MRRTANRILIWGVGGALLAMVAAAAAAAPITFEQELTTVTPFVPPTTEMTTPPAIFSPVVTTAITTASPSALVTTTPTPYPQVAGGQYAVFSGTGFTPNEGVSLWKTGPDKSVMPIPGTHANRNGVVSVSVSFASSGFWQVTAHGLDSGKEVIGGFTVGITASASPLASASAAGAPAGATTVATNQATTFSHNGFQANEVVSFWMTAPDGKATALNGGVADQSGNVVVAVSFPTNGYWQVTAHGLESGQEVIGGFAVGDLTASATVLSGTPVTMSGSDGTAAALPLSSVEATPIATAYPGLSPPSGTPSTTIAQLNTTPPGTAQSTYVVGPVPSFTGKLRT